MLLNGSLRVGLSRILVWLVAILWSVEHLWSKNYQSLRPTYQVLKWYIFSYQVILCTRFENHSSSKCWSFFLSILFNLVAQQMRKFFPLYLMMLWDLHVLLWLLWESVLLVVFIDELFDWVARVLRNQIEQLVFHHLLLIANLHISHFMHVPAACRTEGWKIKFF